MANTVVVQSLYALFCVKLLLLLQLYSRSAGRLGVTGLDIKPSTAKPGQLCKWIEFQTLQHHSVFCLRRDQAVQGTPCKVQEWDLCLEKAAGLVDRLLFS